MFCQTRTYSWLENTAGRSLQTHTHSLGYFAGANQEFRGLQYTSARHLTALSEEDEETRYGVNDELHCERDLVLSSSLFC